MNIDRTLFKNSNLSPSEIARRMDLLSSQLFSVIKNLDDRITALETTSDSGIDRRLFLVDKNSNTVGIKIVNGKITEVTAP